MRRIHRKLSDKTSEEAFPDDDEEGSNKDKDEDSSHHSEEQEEAEEETEEEEADESPKVPEHGPLIDSALIPTKEMLQMANPYLNPMHPLHPFKHEFSVQHHYQTPHGMVTYTNGSAGHTAPSMDGGDISAADMASFDRMMGLPHGPYPDVCKSVQTKAMKIANKLMKDYNRRIFRKIMSYLLKSKFLIGMSEIKLNHIMRKKIYNVMSSFSRVSKSNVEFVASDQEPVLSDEDDSIDSDVQDIDFSEESEQPHAKDSAGEMYDMLNDQMDTQGNVHLQD